MKITGRSSSITNAFINSIVPSIEPTEDADRRAVVNSPHGPVQFQLLVLRRPRQRVGPLSLVKDKKPTGYISEIHNLVPTCGKCNQSNGNTDWKTWMLSDANLSPKSRGVPDINDLIRRLEAYTEWGSAAKIDFDEIVRTGDWEQHWRNRDRVIAEMKTAQALANSIRRQIAVLILIFAEHHASSCH